MKKVLLGFLLVACVLYAMPTPGSCAGPIARPYYITLKPGIYSPQTSDLDHFNTGFNGEVAFGYRYNPNFAAEMGVGYFHTDATFRESGRVLGVNFSGSEKDTIDVVPVTLTLKGIIPIDKWELFGMGGIGAYFVSAEAKLRASAAGLTVSDSANDSAAIFGFHLGLGFHYNITPTWFVGAEGKYLWTSKADLSDEVQGIPVSDKFKMDGILANAVFGFRF